MGGERGEGEGRKGVIVMPVAFFFPKSDMCVFNVSR